MKMRKVIVLGLTVAIVATVTLLAYRSIQRNRDLAETLLWMDQTYNPHEGGENFGQGHGKQTHYLENEAQHTEAVTEDFDEFFTYAKCYVTLHSVTSPVGVFSEAAGNVTFKFNLRDLDPNSFKMKKYDLHSDVSDCADPNEVTAFHLNCRDTELEVSTHNGATSIDEDRSN